jgi:hypothetical protein
MMGGKMKDWDKDDDIEYDNENNQQTVAIDEESE